MAPSNTLDEKTSSLIKPFTSSGGILIMIANLVVNILEEERKLSDVRQNALVNSDKSTISANSSESAIKKSVRVVVSATHKALQQTGYHAAVSAGTQKFLGRPFGCDFFNYNNCKCNNKCCDDDYNYC